MNDRHKKWREWYENEIRQPYFIKIMETAKKIDDEEMLSPDQEFWLKALEFEDISKIHTIIIASRPYNDAYAADGYAFSSIDEADHEMGLLYRKLNSELGITYDQNDNSKEKWVKQGILPLCIELTAKCGQFMDNTMLWRPFTVRVLRYFLEDDQLRAFVFLDRYSSGILDLFYDKDKKEHLIIQQDIRKPNFQTAAIFNRVNDYVTRNYSFNIDWR